jgi:hypothetical protein
VTVTLRAVTGTRTFSAGVVPDGARGDRIYRLSSPSVLVTVGGSEGDLDRLEGQAFTAKVVVAGLEPGEHDVPVVTDLPAGLTVVSINPPNLTVTVSVPPGASAPPSPAPPSP